MAKDDFTIYPGQGYGLLRFGISVASAKALAPTYGNVIYDEPVRDEAYWEEMREYFRTLPTFGTTEAELDEDLAMYAEVVKDRYRFTFDKGITVFLYEDQLKDIRVSSGTLPAFLGEQDVFKLEGEACARYVAEYLQENPYMWEKGMFFPRNGVVLGDYFQDQTIQNGHITWSEPSQEEGSRAVFMGPAPAIGKYNFDPDTTFVYKILP